MKHENPPNNKTTELLQRVIGGSDYPKDDDPLAELARLIGQSDPFEHAATSTSEAIARIPRGFPAAVARSRDRLSDWVHRTDEPDDSFGPLRELFRGSAGYVPKVQTCEPPRRAKHLGLVQVVTQRRTLGPAEADVLMSMCVAATEGPWYWQYRGNRVHALRVVYNADGTTTFIGTACWVRGG